MKRFLAVLAFLCLVTPAAAQCVSVDYELAAIKAHGLTPTALEGDAIKAAGVMFNAVPPESDMAVSVALVVDLPDGGGVLAVGSAEGICGRLRFDMIEWPKARRLLLGVAA